MTTPAIYQFPSDWYSFSRGIFRLQARSQTTARTWIGGKSVYGPHAQIWLAQLTLSLQDWDAAGQYIAAFFSRLDGQAQLMRIGDPARRMPQYNRLIASTKAPWSDSTFFTDGSGWATGALPDTCFLSSAASHGDNFIVLGGLPASTSRALRRGDLLELCAGGIATEVPNLYEVQVDGTTDSSGRVGLEIRPRLRQDFALGDMTKLTDPTSVFRLVDDDQGAAEISKELWASIGFNLVEAII